MKKQHRKLNRLTDYNYSICGYYYITICIKNKEPVFGEIKNEIMILNQYGRIARDRWKEIPKHYRNVDIDTFIIMPNHIHGIIIIKPQYNDRTVGTEQCSVPTDKNNKSIIKNYGLLSKVVKSFKNAVTKYIKNISKNSNFGWQRSFYDHIIRTDEGLDEIRRYIEENPLKCEHDEKNPGNYTGRFLKEELGL